MNSAKVGFLWLDLTRKCQLECDHCYNESGPGGDHGSMSREAWIDLLTQAATTGIRSVQFIGGEPTMHPHFAELLDHALALGLETEIFSNLVHISETNWARFRRAGVSLATSYYSDQAGEHNALTGRPSHRRTRANIAKAVELGIPIRAGIIVGRDDQRVTEARADLESLGVTRIGVDDVRPFGRGEKGGRQEPNPAHLCGRCGTDAAAIGPSGEVTPCVFATWIKVGDVRQEELGTILNGPTMALASAAIRQAVRSEKPKPELKCAPKKCYPDQTPCFPARTPCTPKGDLPPACHPDNGECEPGYTSNHCDPRR
ncbi:radical SAM protein [Streptomyces profundus]|nr:radical SAM protein [Streptomyces sp. MA3_2.13]